jgi:hypothetical protein
MVVPAVGREVLWAERVEQRDELGAAARRDKSGEVGLLSGGLVRARTCSSVSATGAGPSTSDCLAGIRRSI